MKKWKLVDKKLIYDSKWLSLSDNTYILPNGTKQSGYLHLKRGDYVLIFAVNKNNQIIIEKQYRRGLNVFNYELPAGWVDKNEELFETAKRELQEETGYSCDPKLSFEIFPQPAFMEMKAYVVFCQLNDLVFNLKPEEDENIEYELISLDKLKEKIKKGIIKDMGLISAFGLFEFALNISTPK